MVAVLVAITIGLISSNAWAVTYTQQWIANDSGVQATDLELMFSAAVQNMKLAGNPGLSGANIMVGNPSSNWSATGLRVNNGTEVNVRWASNNVPPPTITGGNWTQNGVAVRAISQANGNIMGRPAEITYNQFQGLVSFLNDQSFPMTYTNVSAYVDNDPSNFNIDNFDTTPTGQLVSGIPSSFTLAPSGSPGDSVSYSLGTVIPGDYDVVFATAAPSSNPSDALPNAVATMVPEPTMGFLALGGVCMLLRRRK
jgi:hypothetical protein